MFDLLTRLIRHLVGSVAASPLDSRYCSVPRRKAPRLVGYGQTPLSRLQTVEGKTELTIPSNLDQEQRYCRPC